MSYPEKVMDQIREKETGDQEPHKESLIQHYLEQARMLLDGELTPEQFAQQQADREITLDERAEHDGLVPRALNRNGLTKFLDAKLRQHYRNRQNNRAAPPIGSILFADLDNFKGINDTFSHEVGDEVLRALGRLINGSIRPADRFARYSGGADNFLVFLETAELDDAVRIAERIRKDIVEVVSEILPKTAWTQTVSIGIRANPPEIISEELQTEEGRINFIERWVHETDVAHKSAKNGGRNNIKVMLDDGRIQTASIALSTNGHAPAVIYQNP